MLKDVIEESILWVSDLLFLFYRNCPIDLKEAIASVIFASPRCGDIPELLDVQKHFTAKYGKEFTSAAIELRPNCGVSRMVNFIYNMCVLDLNSDE